MSGWPTFNDVVAFLKEHGRADMATVAESMRDSYQQCREANQKTLTAYYELKVKYEPPPAAPDHRSYLAKPESSD